MRQSRNGWSTAALALAALAIATPPAAAGEHEAPQHKRIQVEKYVHDCQAEDCDQGKRHRRVIVIGDDGEAHEIGGDALSWLGHEGVHAVSLAHHGKGGFLGVATTELTPELRSHFGVPEDSGVLIGRVIDDSAAARAGVQVGDILTAAGGEAVSSTGDLIRAIRRLEPGTAVDLELWRDGSPLTLEATLGERPRPRHHAMVMHCADDDEDCPQLAALPDFDCGDDSDCEVRIECRGGSCECTVNGEAADCETLPGFAAPGE